MEESRLILLEFNYGCMRVNLTTNITKGLLAKNYLIAGLQWKADG